MFEGVIHKITSVLRKKGEVHDVHTKDARYMGEKSKTICKDSKRYGYLISPGGKGNEMQKLELNKPY